MDPKSFAHLDPKLKETYARVMGTTTNNGDASQNAAVPQAPTDQTATPSSPDQIGVQSGPTNFMPTPDASIDSGSEATLSATPDATPPIENIDTSTPPNSSFFSNPSPAATDPSQIPATDGLSSTPSEPQPAAQMPITPYTPGSGEPFAQPLPSPASVNHEEPHEVSSLLKVLYIVGAVLFFAIYTIFWIKVFNLPFLF